MLYMLCSVQFYIIMVTQWWWKNHWHGSHEVMSWIPRIQKYFLNVSNDNSSHPLPKGWISASISLLNVKTWFVKVPEDFVKTCTPYCVSAVDPEEVQWVALTLLWVAILNFHADFCPKVGNYHVTSLNYCKQSPILEILYQPRYRKHHWI